jgi:quinol monooxygenase YgiN
MIIVTATMHVKEGKEEQFIKEFHKIAPKVLKDPGAIMYVLHRDINDPGTFFFYEQYEDEKAVKYHASTPHFKAFFDAIGPITIGQADIKNFRVVD